MTPPLSNIALYYNIMNQLVDKIKHYDKKNFLNSVKKNVYKIMIKTKNYTAEQLLKITFIRILVA